MSDEDAPESNDTNSRLETTNFGLDRVDSLSMHNPPAQPPAESNGGSTQEAIVPWWHRDPGTGPWQRDDGGGVFNTGDGGMDMTGGRVGDKDGDCGGFGRPAGNLGERVGGGCDGGNFRASSVLVRLPGMSPPAPPAAASYSMMEHSSTSGKFFSPGGMLGGMPPPHAQGHATTVAAAAAAAVAAAASGAGGDSRRRTLSPMTIGRSGKTFAGSQIKDGTGKYPSTSFLPLPPHHPSDSIDKQITELAALNDILFGPECEDPSLMHARAAAAAAAGGFSERPHGVTLAALESSAVRSAAGQRCGGGVDGGGGRGNDNGRLPSIAGLVAAGALLSGGEWRSCHPGSSFHPRGRASEV